MSPSPQEPPFQPPPFASTASAGPEGWSTSAWSTWLPHDLNSFLIAIGIVVASVVMIRLLRGTRAQ